MRRPLPRQKPDRTVSPTLIKKIVIAGAAICLMIWLPMFVYVVAEPENPSVNVVMKYSIIVALVAGGAILWRMIVKGFFDGD